MLLAVWIPNTPLLCPSLRDGREPVRQHLGSSVLSDIQAMPSHRCFSNKADFNFHLSDSCAFPSISSDLGEKEGVSF